MNVAKNIDERTIQFVRILPGPIEKVWAYLWDGEKRGEWFASGPMPTKPGEKFEMHFRHSRLSPNQAQPPEKYIDMDRNGHSSTNTLLKYEPPHLLAFTFGPETRPGQVSEVEFRLTPEGDKIRLTLTHRKIPDQDFARGVSGGWHAHLAILEDKANGRVPPAFWDVWRQAQVPYENRQA
jgi:uncharacterized protein YndB with AHSA1/START domain